MFITKVELSKIGHKKLIDLAYVLSDYYTIRESWNNDLSFFTRISPSEEHMVEQIMREQMMKEEISAEAYKGGLIFKNILTRLLRNRAEEVIKNNVESIKKLKLEQLLNK